LIYRTNHCGPRRLLGCSARHKLFSSFVYFSHSHSRDAHILTASSTPKWKDGHKMASPRWLATLAIPAIVGATLITGTGVAVADSTDDAYIAQMHKLGFTWPAGDDSDIIAMGHQICADRMAGKTPDAIAQDIHATLGPKGITFADVTSMVSAAESNYCPG
jgi:hypothetical protein